jgi:type I site-specific restriction endonuclease
MAKGIARRKKGSSEDTVRAKTASTANRRGNAVSGAATRKQMKKTVKNGAAGRAGKARPTYAADYGLMTAFHHMQRASVVMSLMEEGTGEDLRDLLKRGVKLYRKAVEDNAKNKFVLQAIGVLRATEHLSMAGLYAARVKYKQKATSPTPEWLAKVVAETDRRLEQLEGKERGKGPDLFPVTVELARRAEGSDHDAHLAFELAMAADALCFALENGL